MFNLSPYSTKWSFAYRTLDPIWWSLQSFSFRLRFPTILWSNSHYLFGSESDRKLLSSTVMIRASSYMNYASSLLTHNLLSLNVGSLYFKFAVCIFPNLRWKCSLRILRMVLSLGTINSLRAWLLCLTFIRCCWIWRLVKSYMPRTSINF